MVLENLSEEKLKKMADKAVFERGKDYFSSGDVRKIWLEDDVLLAKESQQRNESIKEQLLQLEKEDLVDLLLLSIKTHRDWKTVLLKAISKKILHPSKNQSSAIFEEQFYTLFDRVCEILEEHNEFGGGLEEEEDEVFEGLDEIVNLFKEKKLTPELKRKFIDNMFYYYDLDNSGLEDNVWNAIFDIAESRDEWMYIVKKLEAKNDSYRATLIKQIKEDKLQKAT